VEEVLLLNKFFSDCRYVRSIVMSIICLCVCLSVRISPESHARSLPIFFVRAAYVCGSVLLRHVDDRPHRLSGKGVTGVYNAGEV